MTQLTRGVDQWVMIGQDILVGPTDVDAKSVRIVARGRMLGGPNDGGTFRSVHELARGQSFAIGPCVMVSALEIRGAKVHLAISAPPNIRVHRKETLQQKLKGEDAS